MNIGAEINRGWLTGRANRTWTQGPEAKGARFCFSRKKLCHNDTVAFKNDDISHEFLLYFYSIFLVISTLNYSLRPSLWRNKGGPFSLRNGGPWICQSAPGLSQIDTQKKQKHLNSIRLNLWATTNTMKN